jgi:sulfatase maturation enzyme AslB (radical SAM superfamily)
VTKLSVQWQIGNQCNFRCDYCHRDNHSGSNPFLDYDRFQLGFKHLHQSVDHCDQIEIEFLGGEPTISPAVRDKIADSSDHRYKYILTTNASSDTDWWIEAAKNLSRVTLAWHPYADSDHFKSVVRLLDAAGTKFFIVINAHPDPSRWDPAVSMYKYFKNLNYQVEFKTLFEDHGKGNTKLFPYSKEQWDFWITESNIVLPDTTETLESQVQWVADNRYNNYKGHLCWAGVEQIVIDYFGYVYRSWCHAHGSMGNIFDAAITLDQRPIVCPRSVCKNGFDLLAKKSENSWGLS